VEGRSVGYLVVTATIDLDIVTGGSKHVPLELENDVLSAGLLIRVVN
jgi:hypothetical protein